MLKILKTIDLFGKEPDLYYKGHHKKTSWLGFFLTLLYIIIYFAFFIYKFVRMINKVDVTFYETYAFTGDIPSAVLNKEIFGGGIGLINPKTGENYINERIYVVQSKYRSGVRKEGVWKWEEKPIPLVPCKLEYFGSRYSNIFKEKKLDQLYCFNDVDGLVLQGYSNLNVYSYFDISFYRCVNTTTKHDCLPIEVIDEYLTATQLSVTMQDIDLTPQDYEKPVVEQEKDIPGPLYRDLHQEIYGYLQVTLLETEENIIGFEALSNIKTQMYLKYDHAWVISSPNIYGNYYQEPYGKLAPMTNIRIQLANKVLTLKRYYVQLIDVLGDVGGLMEVIFSLFNILSSLIISILYEESLVNNLFSFDLDKKTILLKEKHNKKKIHFIHKQDSLFDLKNTKISRAPRKSAIISNEVLQSIYKLNDNSSTIKQMQEEDVKDKNDKDNNNNIKINRRNKRIGSQYVPSKFNIYSKNKLINKNIIFDSDDKSISKQSNSEEHYKKKFKQEDKKTNLDNKRDIHGFVDKITLNKFLVHIAFCCIRIPKNMKNILLDEGMRVIMEQLEIFNLFMKLYKEEKQLRNIDQKAYTIEMSEEFKKYYRELENDLIGDNIDKNSSYSYS